MSRSYRMRIAALVVLLLAHAGAAGAGGLSFLGSVSEGAGVSGLAGGVGLAITPDGSYVYVASADDDAVSVFRRDAVTGLLTFVEAKVDQQDGVNGMRMPRGLALSPDGANVYVVAKQENALAVFARNAATGSLSFVEVERNGIAGVAGLEHASGVAVSPDGASVYATGERDDAVAVFRRDPLTGALTFVEVQRTGVAGVVGIGGATAVTLSPDGANVYVTGASDDALTVFGRDASTGALAFVEAERYDDGGHGIRRPTAVIVTADGASVYVAGHDERGVVVFARQPATGALTFVATTRAPTGLKGLAGTLSVTASPDGTYVYVAAENDHAVSVLRRDPATGALAFVEAQRTGRLGVTGLEGASAVAVSPDGAHVYALGHDDDAVTAFATDHCGNGTVGTDEECDDGNLVAGDGCSATCRLELCGAMPAAGCRIPVEAKASDLTVLHKHARTAREELTWRWTKGQATSLADFGDPATAASYALCLYDGSPASQPRIALAAPADGSCAGSPCWRAPSPTSLRYKDHWRTPTGLTLVDLQEGTDGQAQLTVVGRGENMALPALPLATPVIVQLRNTQTGACWEATFAAPTADDATQFKSKSE